MAEVARHALGPRPRAAQRTRALTLAFGLLGCACGKSPEALLIGQWTEVDWRYEKLDVPAKADVRWIDSIAFRLPSEAGIVRHEAEGWEFAEGGVLIIHKLDGTRAHGRWRLKGRGHVLRLQFPGSEEHELYDVKELSPDQLVLHYDIGMEVRGIARLRFRRIPSAVTTNATVERRDRRTL